MSLLASQLEHLGLFCRGGLEHVAVGCKPSMVMTVGL